MKWIGCLLVTLCLVGCGQPNKVEVLTGEAMGTTWRIKSIGAPEDLPFNALCRQLDADLSTWRDDSWVAHFNRAPAGVAMEMPAAVAELMALSQRLHQQTDGRFDVAIGALIQTWGFGAWQRDTMQEPSEDEITQAKAASGMHLLVVDGNTLRKTRDGVMLDFSAIAKGYAVDRMGQLLRDAGCHDFLIEFGGDVLARGNAPGKHGWTVDGPALDRPRVLLDEAIATSGSEHHFRSGLSHVIDPQTGRPVPVGPPAFAIAPTCAEADALATARLVEATAESRVR